MRKFFFLLMPIFLLTFIEPLSAQNSNATLLGRWGEGKCEAVYRRGGFTFLGDGAYLEVFKETAGGYVKRDSLIMPGPIKDIWVQNDTTNIYVVCNDDSLRIVYFDYNNENFVSIFGRASTQGRGRGVIQHFFHGQGRNYAYVAADTAGLVIVDVSIQSNPVTMGTLKFPYAVSDVWVVSDSTVLVAADTSRLYCVNTMNPWAPVAIDSLDFEPAFAWLNEPAIVHQVIVVDTVAYVAAGNSGMHTIDIRNPVDLLKMGKWSDAVLFDTRGVWVHNNNAYLANGENGVYGPIDVSNPYNPGIAPYKKDTPGFASALTVEGDRAYIADGYNGHLVINIQEQAQFSVVDSVKMAGPSLDAFVDGNYLYVANGRSGIRVLNASVTNPPDLFMQDREIYQTKGEALRIDKLGSWLYVADGSFGLTVLDAVNPLNIVFRDEFVVDNDTCFDVSVNSSHAFLACGLDGMRVISISGNVFEIPGSPFGAVILGRAKAVKVVNNRAYLATTSGVYVYDISNMTNVTLIRSYTTGNFDPRGIYASNNMVYLANGQYGLLSWNTATDAVTAINPAGSIFTDVRIEDNSLYTTDSEFGLRIYDISVAGIFTEVGRYGMGGRASGVWVTDSYLYVADGGDGVYYLQSEIRPKISVTPRILNFGPVPPDHSRPLNVWIENTGTTLLEITDAIANKTEFTFSETNFTVAPSDTHLIQAIFSPTIHTPVGVTYPASASILSNADTVSLTLQGIVQSIQGEQPYNPDVFTMGLWHMDESDGNQTIQDATPYDLDGDLFGNPVRAFSKTGFNRSIIFDGADDYIVIPADPNLDFESSQFTAELWFRMTVKPEPHAILLKKGIGSTLSYEMFLASQTQDDKGLVAQVQDQAGNFYRVSTGSMNELNVGQWYHAAVTCDGNALRIYLNGVLKGTEPFQGNLYGNTGEGLGIGASAYGNARFMGLIDEVRLSNVARQTWEFHVNRSRLVLDDEAIDFGNVLLDFDRRVPLNISNDGSQNLIVTSISSTDLRVTVTHETGFTLGAGQDTTVWLTFTPTDEDSLDVGTVLRINSSDPTFPVYEVALSGHGILTPNAGAYENDPFTLGLYHFDEVSGDPILNDASDQGMHGRWNGVSRPAGKFSPGSALRFSQGNQYYGRITPADSHHVGPTKGGFTVEGWFFMEAPPNVEGTLFQRTSASASQFKVWVDTSLTVFAKAFDSAQDSVTLNSSSLGKLQYNQWYHTAMTFAEDTLRLYLNGEEAAKALFNEDLAGTVKDTAMDSVSVLIGRNWQGNEPFFGIVDELRLSNIGRESWEFNVNGARVEVSADTMQFGNVYLPETRTSKLWVLNPGIDVLIVDTVYSSIPAFFNADVEGTQLNSFQVAPKDSQLVYITFDPPDTLDRSAQLTFRTTDPFWPLKPVHLQGKGMAERATGTYTTDVFTSTLYHFEETADTTLSDSSGLNLNGGVRGGATWGDPGRFGNALRFNGSDGWVSIPKHDALDFSTSEFTIEFWMSMLSRPALQTVLVRHGTLGFVQYEISLDPTYGIQGNVWDENDIQYTVQTEKMDTLNLNQWYHVSMSWDSDSVRLAINSIVRDVIAGPKALRPAGSKGLSLGATHVPDKFFHGLIDELRLSKVYRERWEVSVLAPDMIVSHNTLSFALVKVGESRILRFSIANNGDQDLIISSIAGAGAQFTMPDELRSFVLPRTEIQYIPVTYMPTDTNPNGTTLTITSNDTTLSSFIIHLEGKGTDQDGKNPYEVDAHTSILYHFSGAEVSGDTMILDLSGHEIHARLQNGAVWQPNGGFFGGGLYLDGENDYVEIANDDRLIFDPNSESYTIECYFKSDTVSQSLMAIGFEDTAHAVNYGVSLTADGFLKVEGFHEGITRYNDNSWHHMAFTYSHVTDTGTLYIDGSRIWQKPWTNTEWDPKDRPLIIGAAESQAGVIFNHFQGYIDEFRISDIVREPWEFQLLFHGINVRSLNPNPPRAGQDLSVAIHVPVYHEASSLRFHHRAGGSSTYETVAATIENDTTYSVTLPGSSVPLSGLEYYAEVFTANDTIDFPGLDPINKPEVSTTRHQEVSYPYSFTSRKFKMFSVPFDLDTATVENLLVDDLGTWDPYIWRLFWWHREDSVFVDYTDSTSFFFDFQPGRAYWITTDTDMSRPFDTGYGQSVTTDSAYQIQVDPGWNMVGSPYSFQVNWDDCVLSSNTIGTLVYYDPVNGYRLDWPNISPWEGYWLFNSGTTSELITVNPVQAVVAKNKSIRQGVLSNLQSKEWMIKISAETSAGKDLDNFAGVRKNASQLWDAYDRAEPPPIENGVVLSFDQSDWERNAGSYAADIRPTDQDGYVWEFTVRSLSAKQSVALHWAIHQSLPEGWMVFLFDLDEGTSRDMQKFQSLEYKSGKETPDVHHFRMVAGTEAYILGHNDDIPLQPVKFALDQNYPNPFNPETTIRYSLPKKGNVEIHIFNAIGQKVRTLVQSTQKAGVHQVLWDGRDDQGLRVASGIYLYRLRAVDKLATRKMVILK